jgi:hypothetical protein
MSSVVTYGGVAEGEEEQREADTASQRAATLPVAKPARGIMKTSVKPPAVSAKPAVVAVQPRSCCMNCGCKTVLALSTPPTSHEQAADGEVFVAEELDVDERGLVVPLP